MAEQVHFGDIQVSGHRVTWQRGSNWACAVVSDVAGVRFVRVSYPWLLWMGVLGLIVAFGFASVSTGASASTLSSIGFVWLGGWALLYWISSSSRLEIWLASGLVLASSGYGQAKDDARRLAEMILSAKQ